jgi:signal transduction histidine kinase
MEFQPENVDLETLVDEVHTILKSLSNNKQIQIETDLDPRIRHVRLDPRKLKQIVYNYLSNAIKFTPDRGRISVRTRPESEHTFRIEVEDTGIGIEAEDLSQLFVEFQQLDSSAAKRYPGTGLGLALAKRIAEAQGGRVGVESVLGKGSTFYAILPLTGRPLVTSDPVLTAMAYPSAKPDAEADDGALELANTFAFSTEGDEQRTHSDRRRQSH